MKAIRPLPKTNGKAKNVQLPCPNKTPKPCPDPESITKPISAKTAPRDNQTVGFHTKPNLLTYATQTQHREFS